MMDYNITGLIIDNIDEFIIYLSTFEWVTLKKDIHISPFANGDTYIRVRTGDVGFTVLLVDWYVWLRNYKIELINE